MRTYQTKEECSQCGKGHLQIKTFDFIAITYLECDTCEALIDDENLIAKALENE